MFELASEELAYSERRRLKLGVTLSKALATAHARGLVHGALHGGRVFLRKGRLEVEPGGFAMALERLVGATAATRADDVMDLADIIFALFGASTTDPESMARVPHPLPMVLRACLENEPDERPDAPDVVATLRQALEALASSA